MKDEVRQNKASEFGRVFAEILLIILLVFFDQFTKKQAVDTLKPLLPGGIEVWKGVFELHYLENHGMAFGLLQNAQIFFYVVTGIFLVIGVYLLVRTPGKKRFLPMNLLLTLVIAGAVGNLIDRIVNQYVVDFLYVSLIDFPIFNVADCYVTVGIILLAIFLLFVYKDEELKEVYGFRKKEKKSDE